MQDLDDALIGKEYSSGNDGRQFKDDQGGDHLMTPFQCVEYHFINIKGRRRIDSIYSCDQLAEIAITYHFGQFLGARKIYHQHQSSQRRAPVTGRRNAGFSGGRVSAERTLPKEGRVGHVIGLCHVREIPGTF